MAVYGYSDTTIARVTGKSKRNTLVLRILGIAALSAALFLLFSGVGNTSNDRIFRMGYIALFVFGVQLTSGFPFNRRKLQEQVVDRLLKQSFVVTEGEVRILYPKGDTRRLSREEIVRAEEPKLGDGLYLRSSNRYSWLMIPRSMDEYESLKNELRHLGIPFIRPTFPPNLEEFALILAICGAMICGVITDKAPILTADLALSVLLGLAVIAIIRANLDSRVYLPKAIIFVSILILLIAIRLFSMLAH